jgi:hypothetical protein
VFWITGDMNLGAGIVAEVNLRRAIFVLLMVGLIFASGCGTTNATPSVHSIGHYAVGGPAADEVTVSVQKCAYKSDNVTATGVAKSVHPIQTIGLVFSAGDSSGHRIATSTTIVHDLVPSRPQLWTTSASVATTSNPTPKSCYIEVNVGPPPYPGP